MLGILFILVHSFLSAECLQKRQVMVNYFGCCCSDGRGAPQSPNHCRFYRVRRKMGEGEMEDGSGMVMEVECLWNLSRMGMLSCMRAGIGMSVCVLVLVVVVVLVVVLVYMVLTVRIVVAVLAVVVATVILEGVLVEVDCVGVVPKLSSGIFVVVVVLENFGLVLWSSWRMALWCWNGRRTFWDVSVSRPWQETSLSVHVYLGL